MNEFAVAQEIINIVLNTPQVREGKEVVRVKVKAGVVKMLVQQPLESAFYVLSNNTPLEGAELIFEEVPGDVLEVEFIETK